MKIFKFGGASTKDAENVKNVLSVVEQSGETGLVIVVSALGEMTNALEVVVHDYFQIKTIEEPLQYVCDFHNDIIKNLFASTHPIFDEVDGICETLRDVISVSK